MEILFLILKVIGIFLAVLLLLFIVFLSVPVRYGFNIKVQDDVEGKAMIHWLFHLVDVRICYKQKEVSFRLRILGIPIPLNKKKKEKASFEMEESIPPPEEEQDGSREYLPEEKKQADTDALFQADHLEEFKETKQRQKEPDNFSSTQRKKRRRKSPQGRLQAGIQSIRNGFRNMAQSLRQRITDLKNGTTTVKEQIGNIKNLISEETNQNAFRYLMGEFRYLLRHYSPKGASGTVSFAMKDPSQTGKVLGAMSLLPYWTKYKIVVMPDFTSDSFYFKGNLCIKGHIRIVHVLISGVRLIKNKNIRQLITNIRE